MEKTKVVKALMGFIDMFMEGRNYDTINPHCRTVVREACEALGCDTMDYSGAKDIFIEESAKPDEKPFNAEKWGRAGDHIAEMLNIKKGRDGYYKTQWGKKTSIGFMETLVSMINEELK